MEENQAGTSHGAVHRVAHHGIAELYWHPEQEEVEHGTIGSAECITKSFWRDLLSDEFSLENIDHLRYMKHGDRKRKSSFTLATNY